MTAIAWAIVFYAVAIEMTRRADISTATITMLIASFCLVLLCTFVEWIISWRRSEQRR